ncbi:MAG: hypothetical protein HZA93_23915 [Verrucomicrobia bacterium]|nr:hypothetical protein [Verrucomicrobiota bacterium]
MATSAYIPAPFAATGLPAAPVDGAYRLKTDANGTFLQLKAPTGEWVTVFVQMVGGQPTLALALDA